MRSLAFVALACWPVAVRGQTLVQLEVDVAEAACPSSKQLETALAPVLERRVTLAAPGQAAAPGAVVRRARVTDFGTRYVVEIDGARRELDDVRRDCVERARVASVFIALNLKEPKAQARGDGTGVAGGAGQGAARKEQTNDHAADDDEDADEDADEADARADAPDELHFGASLFALGEHSTDAHVTTVGAGVDAFYLLPPVRLGLSVSILAPTTLALSAHDGIDGSVELLRLPLDMTATYLFRAGPVRAGPLGGVSLELLHTEGRGVARPQSDVRLGVGWLAGAEARLALGARFGLLLRVHLRAFPRSYALVVEPTGRLGDTPRWWLGARLGTELHL